MTRQNRWLTAASFREADRVPIELQISAAARKRPECERIVAFIDDGADNFLGMPGGAQWGFFGLTTEYSEEVTEDVPGEYRRKRKVHRTPVGDFHAITKHFYPHVDSPDFQWERRFIHTLGDLERLADAPREVRAFNPEAFAEALAQDDGRAARCLGVPHPLGGLVRQGNMQEAYMWLAGEKQVMHRFLQRVNEQIRDTILAMGEAGMAPWFQVCAHEMLIPPWMGHRMFDEFVFHYDKMVNDAIHQIGGKLRAHCHGNCMDFLDKMADMGIDAIEPLEPAPFGDVDLAEAKIRMDGRMMLSGNIPSQNFPSCSPDDVRQWVREAVRDAAPGGGFALRTTGGHAGVNPELDDATFKNIIRNVETYIEAGLEYGTYPIDV
ncbi:MAG: hypothetical protein HN742_01840 [Lentisphaerae bacterium]|jgi:hypothetical protein|nr:hypothetical protein [Lentisphaerota bacterium]MBT4822278.1 hypothetical protein [Lentisphaerota bacterium]MBT5612349.1 hypothetical protein [Lentisphaerota bacterium]MBT7056653.1 hypothetical protein [Lentisphaerota bacterium]MBT7840578.1 hypothetical protein [Lentisphaerota bacterium]